MPLKNPKIIPGISRAGEKTAAGNTSLGVLRNHKLKAGRSLRGKIKEAASREKKSGIEYLCRAYFSTDQAKEVQKYCISLSTVRQFSVLNYEISVKAEKVKNSINISILGLHTKSDYVNVSGSADCVLCFENLYGRHIINIIKQDGSINSALIDFNIFKKQIELVKFFLPDKKNNKKFCNFEIANDKFTYSKKGAL